MATNVAAAAPTTVPREVLDDLVRRIVQTVHPLRIILFGSAARGQLGPHSDLDVLVVMPDGTHRRRTEEAIYLKLLGFGLPVDVIAVTESDVRANAENPYCVVQHALNEGREVYLGLR